MKRILRLAPIILIGLAILLVIHCAVNPVTGKKELMLISKAHEIEMGREIDRALRMEYGFYQDYRLQNYVRQVGEELVPYTHRPELEYHFAILDTPVENAFAAPGGYIYVTRGLMALMNSKAELATVLGHELGHVNARHSARQMSRALLFEVGLALVSELSKDFRKIAPYTYIAGQLLFLKYSRRDEYQADALGIEYAYKAGYASREMVTFFNSLQRLTESAGGPRLPNFLSTHPLTPRRVQKVEELLQSEPFSRPQDSPQPKVERDGYLASLNGLVYGDNPNQGFVEGNTFYHPEMKFSVEIPRGWKVNNTPRQVTMSSKNDDGVIVLMAEESPDTLDNYTKTLMKEFSNAIDLQQQFGRINGLSAYHTICTLHTPSDSKEEEEKEKNSEVEDVNMQVSCIRKGGLIFTFLSAANRSDYGAYRYTIRRTVNSFNHLNAPRYLKRKANRVFIEQVRKNTTLRQFLGSTGIHQKRWKTISLINSLDLDSRVSRNQKIKVIR
jgi:predicted Zn-dependent protease